MTNTKKATTAAAAAAAPVAQAVTKSTKASTTKATATKGGTPSASKVTKTKAGSLKIVPKDPKAVAVEARKDRVAAALKNGEGLTVGEVAVALAKAEVEAEASHESVDALAKNLTAAKDTAKAKDDALKAQFPLMARLAAELNPNLTAPKTGRNPVREAVNREVVAAMGISPKAAQARVARWVAAGSLWLAHGVGLSKAYTMANTMLSGDSAKFWGMVTADAAPSLSAEDGKRKPTPNGTKVTKETPKPLPVTEEKAREVLAAAQREHEAKMTPAQRGAFHVTGILDHYKALQAGLKDGSITLTKAQATRVETVMATMAKAV